MRLLPRLLPHQALLVVDNTASSVALAFRLHDFSAAIEAGQLRLFVGESAWDDLRGFLESHPGYLAPNRILAWPWFDAREVAQLTQRLGDINKVVAQRRSDALADIRTTPLPAERSNAIVITSNVAQPRIRRVAQMLSAAAAELGRPCETFALDSPSGAHPLACEEAVCRLRPALIISIEGVPETAGQVNGPPTLILLTGIDQTIQCDKIGMLPPHALLGVCSERQRGAAIDAGMSPDRVLMTPPAACPGLRAVESPREGILLVGDISDCSPQAAGLNLATHQRLFRQATEIVRSRIETSVSVDADAVLREAEAKLGVRLESPEVRAGIVDRIRGRLEPSLARIACCRSLRDAGIAFGILGEGWCHEEEWASLCRGPWPAPRELRHMLDACGLLIVPQIDETTAQSMLDSAAAGIVVAVRSPEPRRPGAASLTPLLHESIVAFASPRELAAIVRRFRTSPAALAEAASKTAVDMAAKHTWTRRLADLIATIESRA